VTCDPTNGPLPLERRNSNLLLENRADILLWVVYHKENPLEKANARQETG
jgi:hypothetical protein